MEIKTILVVIDPTHTEQPIINRALRLAKAYHSKVELFVAEYNPSLERSYPFNPIGLVEAKKAHVNNRLEWLEQLINQAQNYSDIDITGEYRWARPLYASIIDRANEIEADLIFKATHHHSLIKRALFTHTDWHLIREATCPVWLVKEDHIWDSHLEIMATIDPMFYDGLQTVTPKVLDLAHDLACKLPGGLNVLHAYEPIPISLVVAQDPAEHEYQNYRLQVQQEHQAAFNAILPDYVEGNAKLFLEEGAADKVIPDIAAKESIDVTVIGAVSQTGIDRMLVGSTAERVLEKIGCDVLVIK